MPFAEWIEGSRYRVWFSARDARGRSQVGWAIVDIDDPGEVLELADAPSLGPGRLGCFDDSGAMLSWIARDPATDERLWYYIGWNLGVTVPFRNAIGLARESAGEVERVFEGPVVDRSRDEPHFTASCCVLPGDRVWRMYYLACTGWDLVEGRPRHRYHLRYAESGDGVEWQRDGRVAIDFEDEREYAISRPSVLASEGGYAMWFSARGTAYRIYRADSADGIEWRRRPGTSLGPGTASWEDEMVCYPHVVIHDDRRLLFYNGNGYGATGFGVAEQPLSAPPGNAS